ncbi:MAG: hypothetical protein CALGDGBN_00839 [Pseudomonadales bacterium]|nr:hypothetical protein [Pseudomonadales bacterium]
MIAQADASAAGAAASPATLLQALAALAREAVLPLLEGMFAACDGVLFDLARTAAGTLDEQRLLDFRCELQRKREAIAARFVGQLTAEFGHFQRPPAATGAIGSEQLTLVPPEQIERQLFVAGGVARARSEAQLLLAELHERMRSLSPAASGLDETGNPLDPGRIAQAFLDACDDLESDMKCVRLLCQQFDAHVLGRLDGFYRRSNQVLIDARVLPLATATAGRGATAARCVPEAVAAATQRTQDGIRATDRSDAGFVGGATDGDGFGELSALLARVRGAGAPLAVARIPAAGAASFAAALSVRGGELAALLGEVQAEAGWPGTAAGAPVDIRAALGEIAARRGTLPLGAGDGDVVDIVTLIFDTVADDPNLPLAIQVLVSRLQLPVLRLALLDRGFFGDRAHPARQLINAIARAGRGWDGHDQESQDALLGQIRALVEALSADPRADREVFARALQQLQECVERAEQRAIKLERRTSEKAVAEARLTAAREAVHAVMRQKLDGRELPAALLGFFENDWQRVLQLFFLRNGADSPEWLDAVAMLDDLPRSLAPPADAPGRGALARALPALYRRLDEALGHTQGDTLEARERVEAIRELHGTLLEPPAPAVAQVVPIERARIQPPPPIPSRASDAAEVRAPLVQEPPRAVLSLESLQRADAIPLGAWFEFTDRNGSARRCKLSARIDETRMLLFCDRGGRLVRESSRKGFAYALQTGEWRLIEDEPLLDRTLERIAGDLRRQAGAA